MPMNVILKEKRKELGYTQEQIAEFLNVSTPAVNKWEKGSTYPDISLLPALARLLKVDLNTLFCFHEGLSEQEINHFCKEVMDHIRKNDFESGFIMSIEKVREYPNCGQLLQTMALLLDGALIMSGMTIGEKKKYTGQITTLYERAAKCDDEKIRNKAAYMLASKYMAHGEYDKAQEMLDTLPERSALDKRKLQSDLLSKQGKLSEASKLLEQKLLMEVTEIQITLITLVEIAQKEGDHKAAADLAEISRKTAEVFEQWDYNCYIAPLQIAIYQENVSDSISLLKSMLSALFTPWEMKKSVLYRHIPVKENPENFGPQMLPALLSEIENDPKYAFLHSSEEFQQLIKQYRAKL